MSEGPVTEAASGLAARLLELLEAVRAGELEPVRGLERLTRLPYDELGFARVDFHRELRQGATFARIAGVLAARAPLVCFLDDDNLQAPDYILAGLSALHDGGG